jgi:polyisoprenoid-binding protein YceI
MKIAAALILAAVLTGAAPQPRAPASIDTGRSKMTVLVYKQGLFAFLADNHEIDAPIQSGSVDGAKSVRITVDAAKMQVLDPKLSSDKRSQVQANMLGPQVLDVQRYPTIEFQSTAIADKGNGVLTVTGNLTLHGQTRSITFDAKDEGGAHFTGSATVRQTAFGITPIKIAGGAVSVKDDVRIEFDIYMNR